MFIQAVITDDLLAVQAARALAQKLMAGIAAGQHVSMNFTVSGFAAAEVTAGLEALEHVLCLLQLPVTWHAVCLVTTRRFADCCGLGPTATEGSHWMM